MAFIFTIAVASTATAPCGLGSDDLSGVTTPLHAVRKLQPRLPLTKARKLALAFQDTASRCGMDWRLLVSIAYHESSLRVGAMNEETRDYGLMQINENLILRFGLSREKLLKDPAYSIEFACKLLKDNHKRYGAKYSYWLGIYRSGTALKNERIVANAQSYDRMIRSTAEGLGHTRTH
jgi:hypothetical protein